MDFALSTEQTLFAEGLDRLLAPFREVPPGAAAPWLASEALETALVGSGYLDAAREEGMGPLEAVLLIEAVARLPFVAETAATALVAPMLGIGPLPRPLAMLDAGESGPTRFLQPGGAVLVDDGVSVRLLSPGTAVEPVASAFAYPFGRLAGPLNAGLSLAGVSPGALRRWRRVGQCAEAVGAMQAALDLTVRHVKDREQFGRPIGAFQAVQHRLAECAVLVQGARLVTYRAAVGSALDADLAAAAVHDATRRLVFETTQLHGAVGLSLEHSLHLWGYRLRALQGELAGAAADAADRLWPPGRDECSTTSEARA
jgi:hypothetical protein